MQGEEILFEDLNSTNGTYVNDKFIRSGKIALGHHGHIVFGMQSGPEIHYRLTDYASARENQDNLFQKAYDYLNQSDYKQALMCFEQVIEKGVPTSAAYYYAGYAAARQDDLDTAIVHFEQYLALVPRDVQAMVDLGKLYERKGLYGKAAIRYRRANELKPGDDSILMRLKDLDRFEPVSDPFRVSRSTEEILGADLVEDISTHHFTVLYNIARHGRKINDILKTLEDAYQVVGGHLGIYPKDKVPVVLLTDESTLKLGDINTFGTASPKGIQILVTPRSMTEKPFLDVLLVHEYVHYLLDTIIPDGKRLPWWLHEGLAQYESQNMRLDGERIISQMVQNDALIPLDVMEKGIYDSEIPGLVNLAYAQAYSLVEYCVVVHHWDSVRIMLHGLAAGKGVAAHREAGVQYEILESSWQEWLHKRLGKKEMGKTMNLKD